MMEPEIKTMKMLLRVPRVRVSQIKERSFMEAAAKEIKLMRFLMKKMRKIMRLLVNMMRKIITLTLDKF